MVAVALGSKQVPYTRAPVDWHENGVPYGAWCMCDSCGLVSRSTYVFDYYAKHAGDPLVCERCTMNVPVALAGIMNKVVEGDNDAPD